MTVCLSDSQLHLFLQTQLPVGHIQDCVQGHTPYSVTDAILTYASSNQGLAQAQEDDLIKEPCLTISYESMERYVKKIGTTYRDDYAYGCIANSNQCQRLKTMAAVPLMPT